MTTNTKPGLVQMLLRVPRELRAEVKRAAELRAQTAEQWMTDALWAYLEREKETTTK